MYYNDFSNLKLSALGLGSMRLPLVDGKDANIDEAKTFEMVDWAMAHGINYYDTAYCYHSGNSETVLCKALSKYPRQSYYLADKFPGFDRKLVTHVEEIFEDQLKKCNVDYFDFYLIHNVNEVDIDAYLDPSLGIFDYLYQQKLNGKIKHLGFSAHGTIEIITRFLEAYGKYMEFGQLQINYIDWEFQQARQKVELLDSYNIPVWVMEPLRGGSLVKLDDEFSARLKQLRPNDSLVQWAFSFLQSIPQVKVILSGMSNLEQLKDNISIFQEPKPLNEQELATILDIANQMTKRVSVPCTGCRYCTSHCPKGLDIPTILNAYNEHVFSNGNFLAYDVLYGLGKGKKPKDCIECHSCESVCPQQIKIAAAMKDFCKRL